MKTFQFLQHRFKHITLRTIIGNQRVFRLIILSAIFVTVCRLLGPVSIQAISIQLDQNTQLDAAFRFVQGLGLTNAFSSQSEVNEPPISELLIHFPPGYSLLVSLFLFLQMSLASSLKIIYGSTTLIGWLFWAILASHCLNKPLRASRIVFPGHLFIAFALPMFYTPRWEGTDIFLWAGIPIVVLLLLRKPGNRFALPLTLIASLTIGLLIFFRYASAFLFPAAFLIIFCIDYPKIKSILLRCGLVLLPYVSIAILTIFYQISVSETGFEVSMLTNLLMTHGARYLNGDFLGLVEKAVAGLPHLYALTGIGIGAIKEKLEHFPFLGNALGLALLFFICVLLVENIRLRRKQESIAPNLFLPANDISIALSCVLMAFVIFSTALTFIISYNPLTFHRYYLPVEPCLILVAYRHASLLEFNRPARYIAAGIITLFLLFNFAVRPAYSFLDDSKSLSNLVLTEYFSISKNDDWSFPSNKFMYDNEKTIKYLVESKRENPNSLYFVYTYPKYLNHPSIRGNIEIRRIPDRSFWDKAFVSQPTRIFWVMDTDQCDSICASPGVFNADNSEDAISELESLPNLKTVFFDAEEGTRIFMSDLPADYQFASN